MMESSHKDKKGAFGLDMGDGKGMEMIDAPMLKQVRVCYLLSYQYISQGRIKAENVLRIARAAKLNIPNV